MHGRGKLTHASGNVWEGEFQYDRKEGKGQALKALDGMLYQSVWKHGEKLSPSRSSPNNKPGNNLLSPNGWRSPLANCKLSPIDFSSRHKSSTVVPTATPEVASPALQRLKERSNRYLADGSM